MIKRFGILIVLFLGYIIGCMTGYISGAGVENHTTDSNISNTLSLYDLSKFERFLYIFKNNIIVSMKNMLLGMFSFGLFSVLYTFYNGFIHGYILGQSSQIIPMKLIVRATLPHSFEFIGIVLFGYVGYILSIYLFSKKLLISRKHLFYILIIATLTILLAAFNESYISMS